MILVDNSIDQGVPLKFREKRISASGYAGVLIRSRATHLALESQPLLSLTQKKYLVQILPLSLINSSIIAKKITNYPSIRKWTSAVQEGRRRSQTRGTRGRANSEL